MSLYACGKNDYYQYGSDQNASDVAVQVNVSTPNVLDGLTIKDITCGSDWGFVITTDDNKLYGFGANDNYNLGVNLNVNEGNDNNSKVLPTQITYNYGVNDKVSEFKAVFANNNTVERFTFFIDKYDKLYAAGDNTSYNLSIDSNAY
jgi:alpha-tubulin suppressor-like RCC1 family protein